MARAGPIVALIIVQLSFASIAAVGKVALNGGLPPLALAGLRIVFAALVLAGIYLARRRPVPEARHLPVLFVLSMLGIGLNQVLFTLGLARTTAVNAQILITTIPVFTLLAALVFRRERFDAGRLAGVGVALAGTFVMLRVEDFTLADDVVLGNLLIVTNALSYSFYLVFVDGMIRRYGSLGVTTWVFLLAAPLVMALGVPDLVGAMEPGVVSPTAWVALVWIVLVPTVIAYGATTYTRKHLSASAVGAGIFLQPLAGISLALVLLPEETLTARAVVSGLLILAGVALVWFRERAAATVPAAVTP